MSSLSSPSLSSPSSPPSPLPPSSSLSSLFSLSSLVNFYSENNRNALGSTTLLSEEQIRSYNNLQASFFSLGDVLLIAGMWVLPIPLQIGKMQTPSGLITYLCVSEKYRGKGLVKELISKLRQTSLPVAYSIGLSAEYSTTAQSCSIRSWYRPLHLKQATELDFKFPRYRQPSDRSDFRTNLVYQTHLATETEVCVATLDHLDFYLECSAKYLYRFCPSPAEWQRWITAFPTFVVMNQHGQPISLFSLSPFSAQMTNSKIGFFSILLFLVGNPPAGLRAAINRAHHLGCSVLYGYEIGPVTPKLVEEVHGIQTKNPIFLSFHHGSQQDIELPRVEVDQILLPLL